MGVVLQAQAAAEYKHDAFLDPKSCPLNLAVTKTLYLADALVG